MRLPVKVLLPGPSYRYAALELPRMEKAYTVWKPYTWLAKPGPVRYARSGMATNVLGPELP